MKKDIMITLAIIAIGFGVYITTDVFKAPKNPTFPVVICNKILDTCLTPRGFIGVQGDYDFFVRMARQIAAEERLKEMGFMKDNGELDFDAMDEFLNEGEENEQGKDGSK